MSVWLIAVLCALGGVLAGAASRVLLGRLRRGTVVRPGPLEAASGIVAGLGAASSVADGPWPLVLWIGVLAVPLAAVDLRHHRLPERDQCHSHEPMTLHVVLPFAQPY